MKHRKLDYVGSYIYIYMIGKRVDTVVCVKSVGLQSVVNHWVEGCRFLILIYAELNIYYTAKL